ncbi:hypothetical protein MTR67_039366, partial [Solanum verrucosum]
ICVVVDPSVSLVGIADQLGDSPFGVVHCRLVPALNIVMLWVIGRHGTASQNFSAMRRLLPFSVDLILSFRAQHTGRKGEYVINWRFAEWVRRFPNLHFFVLLASFAPFYSIVSMLSLKQQIPKTLRFSSDIKAKHAFDDTISIKI